MPLYLLHFDSPFHHAKHYLGFVERHEDVDKRIERHLNGHGSKLVAAVVRAGHHVRLARTWEEGSRDDERALKKQKNTPRYCPICRGELDG